MKDLSKRIWFLHEMSCSSSRPHSVVRGGGFQPPSATLTKKVVRVRCATDAGSVRTPPRRLRSIPQGHELSGQRPQAGFDHAADKSSAALRGRRIRGIVPVPFREALPLGSQLPAAMCDRRIKRLRRHTADDASQRCLEPYWQNRSASPVEDESSMTPFSPLIFKDCYNQPQGVPHVPQPIPHP